MKKQMMNSKLRKASGQRGATLIEVLVSILVISIGILAMVVMQLNTAKFAKTNEYHAMGALLAADLADRMRANKNIGDESTEVAPSYAHTVAYPAEDVPAETSTCNTFTSVATCTPQAVANKDIAEWRALVRNALPQGDAYIAAADTAGATDLWLIWVEPNSTAETNSSGDATNLEPGGSTTCPPNILAASTAGSATPRCMYFRINL